MSHSQSVEVSTFGNMTHPVHPNVLNQHRESAKSVSRTDLPEKRPKRNTNESQGPSVQGRAYETQGVRFVPAEVLFYNAFRGQCYTTNITIVNISAHTMHLAISQPYSSAFHIKDDGTTIAIAPGLSITRKITYKCAEGKLYDSVMPIRVGHSLILLPVKVIPGQVHVTVEPTIVKFGRIDMGSAFVMKTVQLRNKGSIAAKYTIDLSKNELDIMISPRTGTIKPYGVVDLRIQLAGLVVGEHETEFWVKTTPPCRFVVWVTVVVPFLKAIHPLATEEFTLLDMKPTFPGTFRYDTLLVRNSSSDISSVVVLSECDGLIMPPSVAALEDPCFKHFRLHPSDGTLAPFENRIFTMWFAPRAHEYEKGWKRLLNRETTSHYLCFFRVQRVTVTHSEDDDPSPIPADEKRCMLDVKKEFSDDEPTTSTRTLNSLDSKEKYNIIRVCGFATSITPRLRIVPDELIFENVKVGQKLDRVLRITNPCELPLGFSYVKQAHVTVINEESEFIQPNKSVEILVQLNPRSLQFDRNRLVFNLLSHKNLTDQTNVVVIGQVSIRLTISIKSEAKALVPVFIPGITPKVHPEGEEVGLHTETVLFFPKNVDIPNAVVWPKSHTDKPWLLSDARVAFPNERRRSLRVTPHDENVRSIFTGKARYNVPPDPKNVYSPKELEFKHQHEAKYRKYVSAQAARKLEYFKILDSEFPPPNEYDVDDEKLYKLLGTFPPVPVPEFKVKADRPPGHDIHCPLTPLQLFNIKVQPQVVDFGKMPPKTDCSTNISVDNMNSFPIAVRFRSYKESLKVPDGAFIVPGQSTKIQKITLFLEATGKHYTNMSYIINTYHSYDMKVCAEVETRYLITEPGELSFRETSDKDIFEKNFLPVKLTNPLGSKSFFKWKMASATSFGVVPSSGIVPARSSLVCSVFFNLKSGNQLGSVLILQVEEGLGSHFPVNFIPSSKFTLTLFSPKISCPNISLGIRFKKKIIIYNHGRRPACFSVDHLELPKGIKILPYAGTVEPRSCFTLTVVMLFMEIKKFSFKIPISSMTLKNIHLTCNGFVTYPMVDPSDIYFHHQGYLKRMNGWSQKSVQVTFQPKHFLFRTTPVHSHSCVTFTVTNESEADVKVKFLMEEFPQFRISSSSDFADNAATLGESNTILAGQETRTLYLHFEPHDIAGYSFLLPVVINNILGPPVLTDPMSLTPSSYVIVPNEETRQPSALKISGMTVPEKLDTITIDVAVQRGYIKCSSFVFEFFKTDFKEKGGQTLLVENLLTRGSVTFRIKTPDPNVESFSILSKGEPLESMEPIVLVERDRIELSVQFQPLDAGTYSAGVPIYVDEYSKDRPYAILKMAGVFYRSSLACVSSMVNFIPVSVDVEIDKVVYIVANHQPEDSKLTVEIVGTKEESLEDFFTVIFPNTNNIPYGIDNFKIPVKIKFRSESPVSVVGILTAKDGYDGECRITITAIADRSTLTTHAYQFINSLPKMVPAVKESRGSIAKDRRRSSDRLSLSTSDSNPKAVVGTVHNYEMVAESSTDIVSPVTENIIEEIEQFPLFPKSISETVYAMHMRRTKRAMEDWLYEQGFQGQYRMIIGEMIFYSEQYQSALQSTNKNKHFDDVLSILDLIVKLTGREFTAQYPLPPNIPQDKGGRIGYSILVYKAVLSFVMRQGGRLIHVSPLYLLEYTDYKFYHEKLKPLHLSPTSSFYAISQMNVVMARETYERLTIQCWLDVFLQLYKVLIFYPAMAENMKTSDVTIHSGSSDKMSTSTRSKSKLQSKLSQRAISLTIAENEKGEDNLLLWMNEQFFVSRPACVPPRNITNFNSDLQDGVVLALITSHFCPFLYDDYWSNIYWNPANKCESQQNLAILSLVLNKIRIGLTIRSHDLVTPHSVKMIMLCCLLYTALPTYLPHETLFFEGCLADTVHKQLKLTNPASHSIGYTIKKFDPNNAFSLANRKTSIFIQTGGSCNLDITFFAKSINKVSATLVLCGSYVPGGYAKNLVFVLKGMPVKLQHKFAVNITCPLYKTARVKANLNSPFTAEGEFTISVTEVEPKPGKSKLKVWSQMMNRKVIRSIYLSETTMEIPPTMELPIPLNIYAGALMLKTKEYWILFSNQKIGDFVVKVSVIPDTRAPQHILHPPFPTRRCTAAPDKTCEDPNCPRIVHVQIPSKNLKLWSAAKAMLSHTLNDVEKTFWDDYLETPLGLKLMAWISRQYHVGQSDMNFLFQSKVTYKIECNSPLIICPSSITIEDVRSDKAVDLPIHVSNAAKPAMAVDIKLKTDNELRYYQLVMRKNTGDKSLAAIKESTPATDKSTNGDQLVCRFPCQEILTPR